MCEGSGNYLIIDWTITNWKVDNSSLTYKMVHWDRINEEWTLSQVEDIQLCQIPFSEDVNLTVSRIHSFKYPIYPFTFCLFRANTNLSLRKAQEVELR